MKRKLLLAALAFGMAMSSSKAQTVFEEDFNDAEINNWILALQNGEGITVGPMSYFTQMGNIGFHSMAMGATTFDVVNDMAVHIDDADLSIVTPPIVLPAGESTLTYKIGSLIVGAQPGSAHYSLYILTAVDMQGINTISQLSAMIENKIPELSDNISGQASDISHSLSAYEGQTIRVAFRLHDTESDALLLLDDVLIQQEALSAGDFAAASFVTYPNPAGDHLNIKGTQRFETATIVDVNGRSVAAKQLNGSNEGSIDISSLSAGVYIMTVTSDKGTATKKIVKR